MPKSNVDFWRAKIETNIARDARTEAELKAAGWRVIRIWEYDLKKTSDRVAFLSKLYKDIVGCLQPKQYYQEDSDLSIAAEPSEDYQ